MLPEIRYSADEVQRAVPYRYQCVLTEQYSFCPHGGLGELGEDNSSHAGLGDEEDEQSIEDVVLTCMTTPTILCSDITMMARVQASVGARTPYLPVGLSEISIFI